MSDILTIGTPAAHVRLLTITRPKALNALSNVLLAEIADAIDDEVADDEIRAIVVTGGSEVFSTGADVKEFPDRTPASTLLDARGRTWSRIAACPKPLIAAINGYALGGGLELALACDIIVAGASATMGLPETRLGILPGGGGTQRLPRIIGKPLAMKVILAGEFLDAETALTAGLAAEVVPVERTIPRAIELAEKIAARAPLAVRLAKEAVLKSQDIPISHGLDFERRTNAALIATEDRNEAARAFIEKRPAEFKGR